MKVVATSFLMAIALTLLLPVDALGDASGGMLAFVGLLIAMLIPTMALNVTALRPRRGVRADAEKTGRALLTQFDFWAAMLWLSLVLAGLLILGSVLDWTSYSIVTQTKWGPFSFQPIAVLNVGVWFSIGLLVAKLKGFVAGFRSLLQLHIGQVVTEIEDTDVAGHINRKKAINEQATNDDFGEVVG